MDNATLLIVAMTAQCRSLIQKAEPGDSCLPNALHSDHLLRMCDRIESHAADWPATRIHRWIGFVQSGMLANRMLDINGVKRMFDEVKNVYGRGGDDEDLIDHLDPESSFDLDIGGQG